MSKGTKDTLNIDSANRVPVLTRIKPQCVLGPHLLYKTKLSGANTNNTLCTVLVAFVSRHLFSF